MPRRPSILTSLALLVLFLAVSASLLMLVGWGEARRTYPSLHMDKLEAQGGVVAKALEVYLLSAVPLDQISGFDPLTRPLLSSSPDLTGVEVLGRDGGTIFSQSRTLQDDGMSPSSRPAGGAPAWGLEADQALGDIYLASRPLSNRFEAVGELRLGMSKAGVEAEITELFHRLIFLSIGVILLAAAFLVVVSKLRPSASAFLFDLVFHLVFTALSAALAWGLVSLYSEGIQAKTQALAGSLGSRLQVPLDLGLDLKDFSGLDSTFLEYQTLHPEIHSIGLVWGDSFLIHTDPQKVGSSFVSDPGAYEQDWFLKASGAGAPVRVVVSVPKKEVLAGLWAACKNFLALSVALTLVSRLLLDLLSTLTHQGDGGGQRRGAPEKIKVFHSVVVLAEGLCLPVMATWLAQTLAAEGRGSGSVSVIFMAFFAGHAVALIPAGRIVRRMGPRATMSIGAALSICGLLGLALARSFEGLLLLRMLAGMGQGVSLIGVQAALLAASGPGQSTKSSSVIVLGYQTGMIAGTAFGSLLALYSSEVLVFLTAALLGLLNLLFVFYLLGDLGPATEAASSRAPRKVGWLELLRDREFFSTAFLVGAPTKAVAAGIVFFSLPLLLDRLGLSADAIGQILMLYSIGVLLSNRAAVRAVACLGGTRKVLIVGLLGAAATLVMIGWGSAADGGFDSHLRVGLVVAGTLGLGLAHGLLNAPALAHISATPLASRLGTVETASAYRFCERLGSVTGPIACGLLVGFGGAGLFALGLSMLALGWLFARAGKLA